MDGVKKTYVTLRVYSTSTYALRDECQEASCTDQQWFLSRPYDLEYAVCLSFC